MFIELIASAVTLAASADTPMPGSQTFTKPAVPWPIGSGIADFGVKTTSDSYTDGHFSISAPLFSNIGANGTLSGSLVFLEPYISWGEQGEVATSLGLGFRHVFNEQAHSALQERHTGLLDEGIMVGGNVFVDMLDTQNGHRFWQLGFGLEFETRYFALRGNYYHPLTGRQENEPVLQRDVQRATFLTGAKEPFATGHTIQQDLSFTTYDFYTDRLYRSYEEGMKGWDAEAAVMVPWLDQWCELWLIAGYGDFQNKPFGPQIGGTGEMHGWKAGVEFRPIPQLVLSAMHYEEKRMAGGEWMYGLSLQLPLDPEPGNKDKSWWRKLRDTLRPRSRHLAERTAVPAHRQNAAVKMANSISEPEVTQYTKVVSEEEKRFVVRDDVIFVNNGGAQGNGIAAHGAVEDGTAERPFDTIQEGVNLAATSSYQRGIPTVYVSAGKLYENSAMGSVDASNAITVPLQLVSGGFGIPAFGGRNFGLGQMAQVDSIWIVSGRPVGEEFVSNVSILGIRTGYVYAAEVKNLTLIANHFELGSAGTAIWIGSCTNVVIASNVFAGGASGASIGGCSGVSFYGNRTSGDGAFGSFVFVGCTDVMFAGNSLFIGLPDESAPVSFQYCRGVTLEGNVVTARPYAPNDGEASVLEFSHCMDVNLGENLIRILLPSYLNQPYMLVTGIDFNGANRGVRSEGTFRVEVDSASRGYSVFGVVGATCDQYSTGGGTFDINGTTYWLNWLHSQVGGVGTFGTLR